MSPVTRRMTDSPHDLIQEKPAPGVGGLGVALRAADDLTVAGRVGADGDEDGRVLVGAAPAPLEVDAVDEDVGAVALARPPPPFLYGGERLPVEVGDRA